MEKRSDWGTNVLGSSNFLSSSFETHHKWLSDFSPSERMRSRESDYLLVVEAHTIEDFSESGGTKEGQGDFMQ